MTPSKNANDSFWYVDTNSELLSLCERVKVAETLAIDTEFERQKTYYPQLCLVQLAIDGAIACVDPYGAPELDHLATALNRNSVPKVIHSARQDLEVLGLVCGAIPLPLYDTQVAAGLVGFSAQIGYANLVYEVLGVKLEKTETRSDWTARPLLPKQLSYAADDVRYLVPLKNALDGQLAKLERTCWFVEDCARLAENIDDEYGVEDAWRRIKGIGSLSPEAFRRCVALASWREKNAREQDVPRNWIAKDRHLVQIAALGPTSKQQLDRLFGSEIRAIRKYGGDLIYVCNNVPESVEPKSTFRLPLTEKEKRFIKDLSGAVRARALTLNIAPPLLMSRKEIERSVRGKFPKRVQTGWRREVIGAEIVAACSSFVGS